MERHFFMNVHSNQGFYSTYKDTVNHLDHVIVIRGGASSALSKSTQQFYEQFKGIDDDVEIFHSPNDPNEWDGVIFPNKNIGIVNGTHVYAFDSPYPVICDQILDLGRCYDRTQLLHQKALIQNLVNEKQSYYKKAYQSFKQAKKIHEQKEAIYIRAMDFEKADQLAKQFIEALFKDHRHVGESLKVKRRFFGAATPNGAINYIDGNTANVEKRYIIKGRSGSGKSTLMRKIGKAAEQLGGVVEYYPCSFDPYSLDMVHAPKLGIAIFDGTAPHVIDPNRQTDVVIDMFTECIDPSVENRYSQEIKGLEQEYNHYIQSGVQSLKQARIKEQEVYKRYDESFSEEQWQKQLHEHFNHIVNAF